MAEKEAVESAAGRSSDLPALKTKEETLSFFEKNDIAHNTCEHEVTRTVEEMVNVVKFTGEFENATMTKNLMLRDGKKKTKFWLVTASVDTNIDLKALGKLLKASSGKVSFAKEEKLDEFLSCYPGNTNFFALSNDVAN